MIYYRGQYGASGPGRNLVATEEYTLVPEYMIQWTASLQNTFDKVSPCSETRLHSD